MRAYVYTDKSLERYAGRFVWLSVNTESPKNAAFLKKYPIRVLPTLMVLDATGERVLLRYAGGATVKQLSRLLDDASRGTKSAADTILASADKAASQENHAEAAKLYESAIAKAPTSWKSFGRAAESLVFALSVAGDMDRCATHALDLYKRVKGTASAGNVASIGLGCAMELKADAPMRSERVKRLELATREVLDDAKADISADDRSGLYLALVDARSHWGDKEGAKALRSEWLQFLERSAAAAKTAEQRTVYDSHRLTVYMQLGTPEKAIPMLEQTERELPDDYNAPARLAAAYRAMKEYDKALTASDRALAKVYGPRKLSVYTTRADIFVAKGDAESAKKTLADAIAYAKSLPEAQRSARRIEALEQRLAGMK